jgi:hypothetical protein
VGRNNKRPTNTPKHKRPQAAESKETHNKKMPHAARKKYKYNLKDEEAEKTNR